MVGSAPTAGASALGDLPSLGDGAGVRLPGRPGYDRARAAWNLAVDQRPAAVAVPTSPAEVVAVVRAAAAANLRVVPQSTGHNAAPLTGRLEGALLLRLSGLTGVTIDAERGAVRVLGATPWEHVVQAAAAAGFAVSHGSGPDVAVAGYTLGGGLSWYARHHGLACNQVEAAEIVLADGTLRRVHANSDPDLFWALRGGGGNFGVVTALELELLPFSEVYAGVLLWDGSRAREICRAWAEWTAGLPDEVTTSLRLLGNRRNPDAHSLFPGRQMVVVDGAVLTDPERAADLVQPLRALGPSVDTFGMTTAAALTRLHFDPELPSSAVSDHVLLDEFGPDAVDAFVDSAGPDARTTLLSAEVRHLGGALGRTAPGHGALDRIDGRYSATFLAAGATAELRAEGTRDAARAVATLQPWSRGRHYLPFTERSVDPASAYPPDVLSRLRAVREEVDPDGLFVANHPLG